MSDCTKESSNNPTDECPKGLDDYFDYETDAGGNVTGVNFNGEGMVPCLDLDGGFDCYGLGQHALYFLSTRGNQVRQIARSYAPSRITNVLDSLNLF